MGPQLVSCGCMPTRRHDEEGPGFNGAAARELRMPCTEKQAPTTLFGFNGAAARELRMPASPMYARNWAKLQWGRSS